MKHSPSRQCGFSLLELVVVIGIIGLLAAVVLASLSEARAQARDNTRISELNKVSLDLALYRESEGVYPVGLGDLIPTFIVNIPTDPQTASPYTYARLGGGTGYVLSAQLERKGGGVVCYVKDRQTTDTVAVNTAGSGSVSCNSL